MSNEFTPGPWQQNPVTMSVTATTQLTRRNFVVCTIKQDDATTAEEDRANMAMIAAAPDLLAACEVALLRACGWSDNLSSFNSGQPRGSEAERQIRAAIAKARRDE